MHPALRPTEQQTTLKELSPKLIAIPCPFPAFIAQGDSSRTFLMSLRPPSLLQIGWIPLARRPSPFPCSTKVAAGPFICIPLSMFLPENVTCLASREEASQPASLWLARSYARMCDPCVCCLSQTDTLAAPKVFAECFSIGQQ